MLDLYQIAHSGPLSATLADKTAAFRLWLEQVLALWTAAQGGPAWTVATYADPRLGKTGLSPADVDAIMGSPARYAEALWTGREDGYDPTAPACAFDVGLYYGSGIDIASPTLTSDAAAAYAAFRALCYNASDTLPGVLYAAERQSEIVTPAGEVVAFSDPRSVTAGRLPTSGRGVRDVLALSFTVTLA